MAIVEVPATTVPTRAAGRERVAEVLQGAVAPCVLHDTHGPRDSTACVAIGPAGVYVVSAELADGKVVKRIVGGWRRPEERLYVDRWDRTELLDGLRTQVRVTVEVLARRGLGSVPVLGVLCFVGARWPLFGPRPLRFRDGLALWPDALARRVVSPGNLDAAAVATAADALVVDLRGA